MAFRCTPEEHKLICEMAAWSGMSRQDYIIAKLTDTQVEVKPSVSVQKALVGLTTMMCARLFDPASIIAIDIDPARLALARERGLADAAIDASDMGLAAVEAAVRELSHNRGADSVIEAAGGSNTFEMAWRIARPHGVVVLSAMYEGPQTLPLHEMYGKNLVFKTGGVDACNMGETMRLVQEGRIDTSCLISARYPLNEIVEAYRAFEAHEGGCLKLVITPWEDR